MSETSTVPEGHPAHILLNEDERGYPHIEIEVTSGRRPEGIAGIRHWWASATITNHGKPPLNIPVAHMSLTLVTEFLCDPLYALDAIDGDSMLIGEALWRGAQRRPEFEDLQEGNYGPVAIVNSYEVVPEWRRTPLSPILALRMLNVLAELDVSAAALYAAPYNSSLKGNERAAASDKIAAMWERAGFERLYPGRAPHEDFKPVMVRSLDTRDIDQTIADLAGRDHVLREAVE